MNKKLLHLEGLAVLAICIYVYGYNQLSWGLFFILLLTPDVSMLGYVINKRAGSIIYNLFHTYSVPIGVIVCSLVLANQSVLAVGLIWAAHIGMDRMLGFGLKYPTAFQDTHLQRV